jgi:hypothetical protein
MDFHPLLSRIVIVWPVNLPAGTAGLLPVRGTPSGHGVVGRLDLAEGAPMDGHGRGPGRQR